MPAALKSNPYKYWNYECSPKITNRYQDIDHYLQISCFHKLTLDDNAEQRRIYRLPGSIKIISHFGPNFLSTTLQCSDEIIDF